MGGGIVAVVDLLGLPPREGAEPGQNVELAAGRGPDDLLFTLGDRFQFVPTALGQRLAGDQERSQHRDETADDPSAHISPPVVLTSGREPTATRRNGHPAGATRIVRCARQSAWRRPLSSSDWPQESSPASVTS